MPEARGASRVEFSETGPASRQIAGVPTSVVSVVGVTERGPVGVATKVTSFAEYLSIFGGDVADGQVCNFARNFFDEGGGAGELVVVRTVHYANVDDGTTETTAVGELELETSAAQPTAGTVLGTGVAPFALAAGQDLDVAVDGGAPSTATFNAAAAVRATGGAGPYALTDGWTLTVAVDGGGVQTAAFLASEFVDIAAATRAEVAAVLNAKLTGVSAVDVGTGVELRTDKQGTGAELDVTGGTANGVLGFTTGPLAGTGNVADISVVTTAEAETVIEAAAAGVVVTTSGGQVRITSPTTGASSSIQVQASSTATAFGFDAAVHSGTTGAAQSTLKVAGRTGGSYTADVTVKVAAASNGQAAQFNLTVYRAGVVAGVYANLTMDSTSVRYAPTVLDNAATGSKLVALEDLALVGTALARRPANGTFGPLVGGDDGLTSLADTDFLGSAAGFNGLHALDRRDDVSLLAVPDRANAVVQAGMLDYCAERQFMFAVLDTPAGYTAAQVVSYVEGGLLESSEYGALYWPRVEVLNPDTAVYGDEARIVVPASGLIAGTMVRNDAKEFYQPAAGTARGRLTEALGLETDEVLDVKKRGLVYDSRVNPLNVRSGGGVYVDGTKTLSSTGSFPTTSQRRGVNYIEASLKVGLEFARHSNNTPGLRREVSETVREFLVAQMRRGAFASDNPDLAFVIDFGDGLNTPDVVNAGVLMGRIGLATARPADYVFLEVRQDTRAVDAAS